MILLLRLKFNSDVTVKYDRQVATTERNWLLTVAFS